MPAPNAMQWDRREGHYEVWYLTVTDPATGVGIWIRYTMLAPLQSTGEPATAALWCLTMDPAGGGFGGKATFPIEQLAATEDPFELRIGDAVLRDGGMSGGFEQVSWDLSWQPGRGYEHVHPMLRRVASTILVLPHADVEVSGTLKLPGRTIELDRAHGGQAHLWGSKHASTWSWVHCNDFTTLGGEPVPDTFLDGVSVVVSRFGREVGPNTPLVARLNGRDFRSTSPVRVLRNKSSFSLTSFHFEASDGDRKLVGDVEAVPQQLAGVTYHDPDGELAYCYNTETASMRVEVHRRAGRMGGWRHEQTLTAPGRTHFEYAQRDPVDGVELLTR